MNSLRACIELAGILNVAVVANANTTWWEANHNTSTLVDWVRWYEFVPASAGRAVPAKYGG